ncbi:hypothetical protein [Halobacteriovorax sp. DPLXC-1]|uniref:hypothetical protein n=1 Tax=unclassified Halobacteriovorax TaxID=2639665 RepID=UPI002FF1CE21
MVTKNFKEIHNNTQLEALKNEVKGNLFEFLVARQIAIVSKVESLFLKNVDSELLTMMREYESWLRQYDRNLLAKLPLLAIEMAKDLSSNIEGEIKNVTVVGKRHDHIIKERLHEADIVVQVQDIKSGDLKIVPISLKLVKSGANITTKSAGAKSIFEKYFRSYDSIGFVQNTLNEFIDKEFDRFASSLYNRHGLEYSGRFDSLWTKTQLPGELKDADRDDLYILYRHLIKHYHEIFTKLLSQDKAKFIESLLPLMGLGNKDVVQGICFYKHKSYDLDYCHVVNYTEVEEIRIHELNPEISSFNISIGGDNLQVRVKPMNKFTAPSYKINCSMKFKRKD